jgi:hypothetical protein
MMIANDSSPPKSRQAFTIEVFMSLKQRWEQLKLLGAPDWPTAPPRNSLAFFTVLKPFFHVFF